jgi:hypothetical protein
MERSEGDFGSENLFLRYPVFVARVGAGSVSIAAEPAHRELPDNGTVTS